MRQLYHMHCYNRHNILDTIAIDRIVISTNLYPSRSNMTFRNNSIAVSPILVLFWGPYRSIGLMAIFSGSEDQNIVLSTIIFFQRRLNYQISKSLWDSDGQPESKGRETVKMSHPTLWLLHLWMARGKETNKNQAFQIFKLYLNWWKYLRWKRTVSWELCTVSEEKRSRLRTDHYCFNSIEKWNDLKF